MSPVHGSSLVDLSIHSPAVIEMLQTRINRHLIEYLARVTMEVVDFAMESPCFDRGRKSRRRAQLIQFITNVVFQSEANIPALLVALVYIKRSEPHLCVSLEKWACERLFLGALIVASKYINDSTLKNIHWAICTGMFAFRDIGRVEREFLDVLDWELSVQESDITTHYDGICSRIQPSAPRFKTPRHNHPLKQIILPITPCSNPGDIEEVSCWSDSDDTSSSTSSSSPYSLLSCPPSPIKYAVDWICEEMEIPPIPVTQLGIRYRHSLAGRFDVLRLIPSNLHWSNSLDKKPSVGPIRI